MSIEAIDREFAALQQLAGAPREVRIDCVDISHERMGFCTACAPVHLEVHCWRLLALRAATDRQGTR